MRKRKSKANEAKKIKGLNWFHKKIWDEFAWYIKQRDDWTCICCNKHDYESPSMHAGHYISRSFKSTLYDEMNVHCQCARCNIFLHGNLVVYRERLVYKYGEDAVKALEVKRHEIKKWTREELNELRKYYENKIRSIE